MALDWCINCVSIQYLGDSLIEVDLILYMHWYWQDVELKGYYALFVLVFSTTNKNEHIGGVSCTDCAAFIIFLQRAKSNFSSQCDKTTQRYFEEHSISWRKEKKKDHGWKLKWLLTLISGADRYYDCLELMYGFRILPIMKACWMFITPVFTLVCLCTPYN